MFASRRRESRDEVSKSCLSATFAGAGACAAGTGSAGAPKSARSFFASSLEAAATSCVGAPASASGPCLKAPRLTTPTTATAETLERSSSHRPIRRFGSGPEAFLRACWAP